MAKRRLLFDMNVLVYAHDELSPFHEPSAILLDTSHFLGLETLVAEVPTEIVRQVQAHKE